MDTRYQTLLDELHTNKKQLTNYRQRFLNIQNQLLSSQQENRKLKKNLESTREQIQKLSEQNKFLTTQKQALMNDYSTSVESIKQEITKKQQQIYSLKQKENNYSPMMNQKLIQRQIRCQIESQFQEQLEIKQKKVRQLQQQLDRMIFDKEVQKQKNQIKMQALERELKQMQSSHMLELQNYANRTYQNSQSTKTSEEQSLIKKLRRQIDELRLTLDHTQQQVSQSFAEKTKIQKQHSLFITKHKQQVQKFAEQIRMYQKQNQKLSQVQNRNKNDRDQFMLKEKEKQIKNLRQKIEQLHELITKMQNKLSEIQVQYVAKCTQVKKMKDFSGKHQSDRVSQLRMQKQSLQRQINELKYSNENVRKQNLELMNSISQIQTKSIKNIKQVSNNLTQHLNEENIYHSAINIKKKRHLSIMNQNSVNQQDNYDIDNSFGLNRATSPKNMKNQTLQNQKKYYEKKIEQEINRNKELAQKYIELKKKFRNLQQKFKEANHKVVGLIRDKIQLGSPTAASKKSFEFPVSPNVKRTRSPNIHMSNSEGFYQNPMHSRTQGNLATMTRNVRYSPQNSVNNLRKPQHSTSPKGGDQSFYQKSLKIKTAHKFRQIKCLNHDDKSHDHRNCSHSPIKLNQ